MTAMEAHQLDVCNARIWTGDPRQPWANRLSIRHGRVLEVGDGELELTSQLPAGAGRRIDAAGRTITPGLIDAHTHLLLGGQSLSQLDLSHIHSREAFESAIAARHKELPPEQWLIATGWSQENWPGGELPNKNWLAAAGDRPVVCYRTDLHAAVVNDAVLAMCDASAVSDKAWGSRIVRHPATNEPTGLFVEEAAWQLINPIVPEPDVQQRQYNLSRAIGLYNSLGLTAAGSMEYSSDLVNVYVPLRDQLTLRCRITLLDRDWPMDFGLGRDFDNDDVLAVIGYKAFIDGTLGSRTARMLAAYSDDPGNRGLFVELAEKGCMHDWIHAVTAAGLSPAMHAIGDEAARAALDAIDTLDDAVCQRTRPRIEHAQQLDAADIGRFSGRIASMQPLHRADDGRYAARRVGEERLAGSYAFRRLLDAGAVLAFGSDWPVVSPDPVLGIRAAVTGLTLDGEVFGEDQNLDVTEAMRAYTAGAAFALGLDDSGVLRPGALGDFVMWDRDPFLADWINAPPRVIMTVLGGTVVYER